MIEVPQELLDNPDNLSEVEINKKAVALGINILDLFKAQQKIKQKISKERLQQTMKSLQND
jgi:hypothetical protein